MKPYFKDRFFLILFAIVVLIVMIFSHCTKKRAMVVTHLKCENCINPIGVDESQPRFSWIVQSDTRGQKQTAHQILVASRAELLGKNTGDMWDSGKVLSGKTAHISYAGKSLKSNHSYFWKVQVWDKDGKPGLFSDAATFTTAILNPGDWQAQWIGEGKSKDPVNEAGYYNQALNVDSEGDSIHYNERSLLLRKEITIPKSVESAKVHICGLGYYELTINGQKIGDKVLSPAKTNYRKIVLYDTYDVTSPLKTGQNTIGIMLGNGWFNPLKKWWTWRMQWFGAKRAILQMHLTFSDGTSEIICSDASWKIADGPITRSCIYDGEVYDANQEIPGWNDAGFDDTKWDKAVKVAAPGGKMVSQLMPPIKITQIIMPRSITKVQEGRYVVDMGQNFSGWVRVQIKGKSDEKVTLRYAENLKNDGMIDIRSNNLAAATDVYILKGNNVEIYEPRFTYHGFRYVEISGYSGDLNADDIKGIVVHSAVEPVGKFECSNQRINTIHETILWSQRANLMGFPTDCPQRDERLGWIGDAHVTAEEAIYNFDMNQFYIKWLNDIKSNQNPVDGDIPYIAPRPFMDGVGTPAWSSGYHLIVWYLYQYYGDVNVLAEHFDAMKKYVDHLSSTAENYILPSDQYGDWLSENTDGWWKRGDPLSTSTGYYYYTSQIVAKTAKILGHEDDIKKYETLAKNIKQAWHKRFFDVQNQYYDGGSQFSNTFPLFLNIVPDEYKQGVLSSLINDIYARKGHLSTGILGTKYMMELLLRENRGDIAYLMANQPDYPGWADLIHNRTTLSEHWNQSGSNNHVMFGSVDAWFYKGLAGINTDENAPGFEHIIIKPFIPAGMSWVKASVNTIKGLVKSEWERVDNKFTLKVTIPVNSTASIYILAKRPDLVKESGQSTDLVNDVSFLKMDGRYAVFQVQSGDYSFSSNEVTELIDSPYVSNPKIFPADTFIYKPDKVTVRILSETDSAEIRYTLDGSPPTENALLYTNPIVFETNTTLLARAYKTKYHPSFSQSVNIYFVDPQINGLRYSLYEGAWTQLPDFTPIDPVQSGTVYQFALENIKFPKYDFALVFNGFIDIKTKGNYTFYTKSNDGSQLFINNKLIVNNDKEHIVEEQQGKIFLTVGKHAIKVTYFQSGGATALQVLYEGPDLQKQVISPVVLFQNR